MARKRKTKYNDMPFVKMHFTILNSLAYKDLPGSACKLLPLIIAKVRSEITNPERHTTIFQFPYGAALRFGVSKSTFFKVICDLVKFGFIDPVTKGGLRSDGKVCSTYKLSCRWEQYGTKEFRILDYKQFYQGKTEASPIMGMV